jgi:hypothetical protein
MPKYANGQEANKDDLIVFTDNSSVGDYDAVGILVSPDAALNVRPVARLAGKTWLPTTDHLTRVAIETAMPVPDLSGLRDKVAAPEEVTGCAKEQFRPGRHLAHGVCERCLHNVSEHPWTKPVEKEEEKPA